MGALIAANVEDDKVAATLRQNTVRVMLAKIHIPDRRTSPRLHDAEREAYKKSHVGGKKHCSGVLVRFATHTQIRNTLKTF